MSLEFLLRADSREDFEAMAKSQGFMDEDGQPVPECVCDPSPDTLEYETGILITGPEQFPPPAGWYVNFRVWGSLEAAQTEPLDQMDEDGNLLALRERTTFGAWMTELGEEGVQDNGTTTFVTASRVSFIDPENVRTRQRIWQ